MPTTLESNPDPQLLAQFREWVELEWGEVDPIQPDSNSAIYPDPVLALDGDTLVGGLSFTSHARPGSDDPAVWINTLYVSPGFRKRGIASDLICAAECRAMELGITELFVFTDIPPLYQKQGWAVTGSKDGSTILEKRLAKNNGSANTQFDQ